MTSLQSEHQLKISDTGFPNEAIAFHIEKMGAFVQIPNLQYLHLPSLSLLHVPDLQAACLGL